MKKFILLLCSVFFFVPQASAFRDISPNSKLLPAIQNLVDRGVLQDRGFFRPDSFVPAKMLLEVLFRDAGFDPHSADFGTPLPPNIKENDLSAPFIREAIRRGFLNADEEFDGFESVSRLQAIKAIIKTKGILLPKSNSKEFRKKVGGVSPRAKYLIDIEAAFASNFLELSDVDPLRPFEPVSRRDFVTWLYRYHDHGIKKSSLDSPVSKRKARSTRRHGIRSRSPQPKRATQRDIKIEIISDEGDVGVGNGLRIPNARVLESIFGSINARYRFVDELTEEKKTKMIDAAITAMVKELGDKYSSYIEPEKVANFKDGLDGKFEGIGAYVEMIKDDLIITAPIKGSPAEKAGIEPGDVVITVDGESIKGNTIRESIDLIRGPKGTKVVLGILRDGMEKTIDVIRGRITIPSITLKWKNSVPIIGIHQFNRTTGADFKNMWQNEVLPKKPRGLVLDLRNNPGGFLTSAVEMGEFFLEKGKLIFSVEQRNGEKEYRSSRDGELASLKKLAVLQNKGSASASEIFTGMIQDYGIGKIVGAKSLGKGTVQEISNYSNGATLKLTVAKWLTPKDRWIHEDGIVPDVEVDDSTTEEKKKDIDRQLDAAIREILNR